MVHANSVNQWPYLSVISVNITSDCSCTYSIVEISKHNTSLPVLFCYSPGAWTIMGVEETLPQMYIALVFCLWLLPRAMQHCLPSNSQYTWEVNASSLSPCVHTSAQIWVPICPVALQSNHGYWATMINAVLAGHSPLTVPVPPIHQESCELQMRLRSPPSPTNSLLLLEQNMLYNVSQQSCNTMLWNALGIWLTQITHFHLALFEYPSWPTFFTCVPPIPGVSCILLQYIPHGHHLMVEPILSMCVSTIYPKKDTDFLHHLCSSHPPQDIHSLDNQMWHQPGSILLWIHFINFCVKWVMPSSKFVYKHTSVSARASWIWIPWSCQ